MKGSAFAAYAVRGVVRNPRRTASALLGVLLGVAAVTAPWIALDSTLTGLVRWYVEGLSADAIAAGSDTAYEEAALDLAVVPNVERIEPVVQFFAYLNASRPDTFVQIYLVQSTFGSIANRLGLNLSTPPELGGIVVHRSLQDGWGIGDPLTLEVPVSAYDANGTPTGFDIRTATYAVAGFYDVPDPNRLALVNPVFMSIADLDGLKAAFNATDHIWSATLFVWLDRGVLLDPYDAPGSSFRLQRQQLLMGNALLPHGFFAFYPSSSRGASLADLPNLIESRTFFLRLFFFVFAIPMIALAALLAKVGFDIGLAGRRRELAVLKARGASPRGIRAFLVLEATTLSVLGALLGLGLGLGLSRLFLESAAGAWAIPVSFGDVALTTGTLVLAFLFAWILAVGASWRAIRIVSSEDIVTALKAHHAEEVSIPHRASRDFLLAGVAAAGLLLLIASASLKGSPFSPLTFLLGVSTALLVPIAPFLLTVAVARYLTRGTSRAYRSLSRLLRPSLGELQPLVEKNLVRAPRRSSNTTMIVTFAVGFVVAVLVAAASYEAFRDLEVLRYTPSDIVAEGFFVDFDGPFSASHRAIRTVPGVAAVSSVVVAASDRGVVVAFEASTYLRAVPWVTATQLGGVDPRGLMDALAGGNAFAANPAFAGGWGVQVGDPLRFDFILSTNFTALLAAVVPSLPGLYSFSPDDRETLAYVDLSAVGEAANFSTTRYARYLVGLEPGADSRVVAAAIGDLLGTGFYVRTLDDARSEAASSPFTAATFAFLRAQIQVALGMLVVAIGLFVYSAAAERREEFATLVARGFGPKAVRKLLMAEGWIVSLLGLLVGTLGGLLSAATFLALASLLTPTPVPFVVPLLVIVPMIGAGLGVMIASFLGAASIQGMDLARVLKLRGG